MGEKPQVCIEGYSIVRQIGQGGMSTVYEARDVRLHRTVAIKVLHPHFAADRTALARFRREAMAAARIDHPAIVRVYDFRIEKQLPCIIMEYVPGTDMEQVLLRRSRIPFPLAAGIMNTVASALAEAHEHGILHRDVKPANILLHHRGRVMLSDFGIARMGDDERLTSADSVAGTPSFMSPEQICGRGTATQSDVYSWAVTFHFLVCGTLPYRHQRFPEVIHDIQTGSIHLDEQGMSEATPRYYELMLRCLKGDPHKRITDAMVLRDILDEIQIRHPLHYDLRELVPAGAHPSAASAQETRTRTRVLRRRGTSRQVRGILALLFALLLLAAVWMGWHRAQDRLAAGPGERAHGGEVGLGKLPARATERDTVPDDQDLRDGAAASSVSTPERVAIAPPLPVRASSSGAVKPPMSADATSAPWPGEGSDTGGVFIYCSPWAQVLIDGKDFGTTPLEAPIRLPAGRYALELLNEFCEPFDTLVQILPDSVVRYRFDLSIKAAYRP